MIGIVFETDRNIDINGENSGYKHFILSSQYAEPHGSVVSIVDLRTGGRWFDSQVSQQSVRGLMIVIATESIPLSPLSIV